MAYFLIGSNHELADTSFSSKVAFTPSKLTLVHNELVARGLGDCALVLSTCNRSEVFVYKRQVEDLAAWQSSIEQLILQLHNLEQEHLRLFYQKLNFDACLHLFKVASGLDSLVLGEPQITGQIKDALTYTEQFYAAQQLRIPPEFHKLLAETFACAKEIRSQTSIGKHAVSLAYMACKIAREHFADFQSQILLVGASQTNLLLARHLLRQGFTDLVVANRSEDNAKAFLTQLDLPLVKADGTPRYLSLEPQDLAKALTNSDLAFSSTSAPAYVLTTQLLTQVQQARQERNLLLFDLAIPNDIEPSCQALQGVLLFNRDNLQDLVNANKRKRLSAAKEANPILAKYLEKYKQQTRVLQGNDIIVEYRRAIHAHRQQLLDEALQALAKGAKAEEVLTNFSQTLTNKILHTPTLILSSFIKQGQQCALTSIHTYLDRNDRESLQEVVEQTLEKEAFKNSCCKFGDGMVGAAGCCRGPAHASKLLEISDPAEDSTAQQQAAVAKDQENPEPLASLVAQGQPQAPTCPVAHKALDAQAIAQSSPQTHTQTATKTATQTPAGNAGKCPVDHQAIQAQAKSPVDQAKRARQAQGKCPVDHAALARQATGSKITRKDPKLTGQGLSDHDFALFVQLGAEGFAQQRLRQNGYLASTAASVDTTKLGQTKPSAQKNQTQLTQTQLQQTQSQASLPNQQFAQSGPTASATPKHTPMSLGDQEQAGLTVAAEQSQLGQALAPIYVHSEDALRSGNLSKCPHAAAALAATTKLPPASIGIFGQASAVRDSYELSLQQARLAVQVVSSTDNAAALLNEEVTFRQGREAQASNVGRIGSAADVSAAPSQQLSQLPTVAQAGETTASNTRNLLAQSKSAAARARQAAVKSSFWVPSTLEQLDDFIAQSYSDSLAAQSLDASPSSHPQNLHSDLHASQLAATELDAFSIDLAQMVTQESGVVLVKFPR